MPAYVSPDGKTIIPGGVAVPEAPPANADIKAQEAIRGVYARVLQIAKTAPLEVRFKLASEAAQGLRIPPENVKWVNLRQITMCLFLDPYNPLNSPPAKFVSSIEMGNKLAASEQLMLRAGIDRTESAAPMAPDAVIRPTTPPMPPPSSVAEAARRQAAIDAAHAKQQGIRRVSVHNRFRR